MKLLFLVIGVGLLVIGWLFTPSLARAQIEISDVYDISANIEEGDIVSVKDTGMSPSSLEYDPKLFGVVQKSPLAVYRRVDGTGVSVARTGNALVSVTDENGPIKVGDYITSSSRNPGKGQKATISGYVIGVALSSFDGKSGKIPVAIKVEFAELTTARSANRLFETINASLFQNAKDPEKFVNIIRYVAVAIIDFLSIAVGLLILLRVIPKGVEGIGRNPTAKKSIIAYTVVNLLIVAVVIFIGVGASILLIRI